MAANDNTAEVRIVGDASQVAPAVAEAKSQVKSLASATEASTAQMKESFSGVSIRIHEMGLQLRDTFEMMGAMREILTGIGEAFIAAFALEKVADWAKEMGEAAEKTAHLAATFGMSTNEVRQFGAIATVSGIPLQSITRAMQTLDKNAITASEGTGAMATAFKAMGLSINDGRTQLEKLEVVADKFKNMDDGPKKVALAMELMGRQGAAMIPILNQGSEGLRQLAEKATEYDVANTAVSDRAQEKGMALAEAINETKLAWSGVVNVLTDAFAPIMTTAAEGMNSLISAMVESYNNGGLVAQVFQYIGGVCGELSAIIEALAEIFKALWDAVSDVMSSIAAAVADVFGTKVPSDAASLAGAFNITKDAVVVAKDIIIVAIELIGGAIVQLVEYLQAFAKVAVDAFTLNWGAIVGDWQQGMARIDATTQQTADHIKSAMAEAASAIVAASQGKALPSAPGSGGIKFAAGGDGDFNPNLDASRHHKKKDDLPQRLEAELEAKKTAWAMEQDAQGTFQQYSLQSEADFWAEALKRQDLSTKDRLAIEQKYLAARSALKKDEIGQQVDAYKEEIAAAGQNWTAKLALLQQEHDYLAHMYGDQSKEARAAQLAITEAERQAIKQREQLEAEHAKAVQQMGLAEVDRAEAEAQFRVQMGQVTERQLIQLERQFEDERYQIRLQALQRDRTLIDPDRDPVKYAQISGQIEALEQQHQNKLAQIDQQAVLQRTAIERQGIQSISQSFAQSISQMLTLQQGFAATIRSLWQGLANSIAQALASMIEQWIAKKLTALIIGKAADQTAGSGQIATNAAVAASGAYAATAAIPFIGPELAPAAAATAYAGAIAWLGAMTIGSAEGGAWQVGGGLYELHPEEMVLPSWAANPLRSMLTGGGAGSPAGLGQGDVHFHSSPTFNGNVASWQDMVNKHERDMLRWLNLKIRNGALKTKAA